MSDQTPVVSGRALGKVFGGVEALSNVSIDLFPGECVGLAGDNGAGKSTLLKLLTGVLTPTSGSILLGGMVAEQLTPAKAMAYGIEIVYQDLSLADHLSAAENIFLGRERVRRILKVAPVLDRAGMSRTAEAVLSELGITSFNVSTPVGALSGGQRQMVAIARAMTFSPRVVILDEPTAALSATASAPVLRLIRELPKRNVSVVLVSHRIPDMLATTDRIYVLRHGRNVTSGPTSGFSEHSLVSAIAGIRSDTEQFQQT